jgi:hypothetical protein
MMDPIYPWLDPVEVRQLAEGLMKPARETPLTLSDAGFDEGFEGFAKGQLFISTPPVSTGPPQALPTPPELASPAPEVPAPAAPIVVPDPPVTDSATPALVEPESQESARGPFLDRINRFRDWMRHEFSATGIFILDRDGSVIFDESTHGRLHFLARSLALASRRPGASGRNVHVKIGAGATLEVIPVETAYGCLVLGAVVSESLPPASVHAVMEALSQAATPQNRNQP